MKNFKNYTQGIVLALAVFFISNPSFAAVTDTNQSGGMSNTTIFYILCTLAIILLIGIFFLTNSVKDLMQSEFYKKKIYEEETKKRNNSGTITALLLLIGFPYASFSQDASVATSVAENADMPLSWVWMMVIVNLILLCVVFYIRNLFFQILRSVKPKKVIIKDGEEIEVKEVSKITQILTDAVPLEKEHEILMDHEYDGIHELDNNLPPWWLWSFYASIVFAVVYLFNYHIVESSPLQAEEYEIAIEEGKKEVAAFLASQALNVDETSVVALTESSDINSGKGIFEKKCVACHGKEGEGIIGPNLTDNYWINGGDIKSIFKIVKYGNNKGMQSWKDELNPVEMQQVSSYIKSIKGTAIGKGKEPEGKLHKEESTTIGTTQTSSDSSTVETDTSAMADNQ